MPERFSSIDEAAEAIGRGEVVIVVDAEDRENEGDFVAAADRVSPEIVNFMITHGRGQLCMPVLPEVCQRLEHSDVLTVESAMQPLLRDVSDHVRRVREEIDALREVLAFAYLRVERAPHQSQPDA